MPRYIRGVGIDAAFSNMGFAHVEIGLSGMGIKPTIRVLDLVLVQTEVTENRKVVRKSSTELRRAKELVTAIRREGERYGNDFAFVEVPSGSQSASAARALGIAVGVLASCPIPIIEVSPQEVKEAVLGSRKGQLPSKAQIIEWASKQWPEARWLRHERSSRGKAGKDGKRVGAYKEGDLLNANEHLADALGAVMAGINTPEFQRLIAIMPGRQEPQRRRIEL